MLGVLKLAELYDIGKEDLERIVSLKPYFTDEFKKRLAEKTKNFVFEKLPHSAELLRRMKRVQAFDKTIEKFFDTLFIPEKLEIYVETVAKTHKRVGIDLGDFLKDFAIFFKEILEYEGIPSDRIQDFKKLIFLLILVLNRLILNYLESLKLDEIDPITKLPTRRYFIIRFPQFLESFQTVLLIDLEEFKEFNLYYGYDAGNSVLAFVASALQAKFEGSFITRLQNDEFLIFTSLPPDEAYSFLRELKVCFQREPLNLPAKFGVETVRLDFSAVVMDMVLSRKIDSDMLMWILYNSLEEAKESPDGMVVVNTRSVEEWLNNKKIVVNVMEALNRKSVEVAFQNVIDINTGKVVFREALARLIVDGKLVPADKFINLISGTNIERNLDRLVVERTLKALQKGLIEGKVSLNLSSGFIKKNIRWFLQTIEDCKISPDSIIVELVERDNVLDVRGMKSNLELLKEKGMLIFIDDFGVKYANYNLLKELPVDGIKIDGSIVRNIKFNELDSAFISCVFQFAKIKNVKIVAEYVETEEVEKELERIVKENQIENMYVQGYYFGKPVVL